MMKNKIQLRKYLIKEIILTIMVLFIFGLINYFEYQVLTKNNNAKMAQIINLVQEKYPLVKEEDLILILNNYSTNLKILHKYGILETEAATFANTKVLPFFLIGNIIFLFITICILTHLFLKYNRQKEKELKAITDYIEEINHKNYTLKIDEINEDELSILKNEIYKITIMLKESAEQSEQAKKELKKSLEDISHQLKTPLTSILIILDNLIDNPHMADNIRQDFIHDIKREMININFLIQNLLKLSKFDANTIEFLPTLTPVKKILTKAQKNVATLCDLKNIPIKMSGAKTINIVCDFNWEVEAITNIFKNCIEHSKNNSLIETKVLENKAYVEVQIIDHGEGIKAKDLPHIFERFYKTTNSSQDSMGIGLALAKEIIKKDNGIILVSSNHKGSIFTIKYFKY